MGSSRPRPVVLDAGALIGFERGTTRLREIVRAALHDAAPIVIPAGVLAQTWRDGSRQARLARLVDNRRTAVEVLDERWAKAAGVLCGQRGTADVVDASVVVAARRWQARVVTSDPADLRRLDPDIELETV